MYVCVIYVLCVVYGGKEVRHSRGLGQLMGMAHKRTLGRATDQQEDPGRM